MKKEARIPWIKLTTIDLPVPESSPLQSDNCTLCTFCRYANWDESPSYECEHPFEAIQEKVDMLAPEEDCWGFRPSCSYKDGVDMVEDWLHSAQR